MCFPQTLFPAAPDAALARVLRLRSHVSQDKGWLNDPNGLIYYGGRYHVFFQTIPDKGAQEHAGLVLT